MKHRHRTGPVSRRAFLSGAAAVSLAPQSALFAGPPGGVAPVARGEAAYRVRVRAAARHRIGRRPAQRTNGDEERYGNNLANFSKGLPHNVRGEMSPEAYGAFVRALTQFDGRDVEALELGDFGKLVNPRASFCFVLEGPDPQQLTTAPPPAFASEEAAAEMTELYWQALLRDVPLGDYDESSLAAEAAGDLANWGLLRSGHAADLFRMDSPGSNTGPWISQFLWRDVPQGAFTVPQRLRVSAPGVDYMFTPARWIGIQNGEVAGRPQLEPEPRYIRTGRDLATYVHHDYVYQAFLNACLILLGMSGAIDGSNPYRWSRTQAGFSTFGEAHVLDLVARVANVALKAVWYHKWLVHRRLRPEEFGGRVHRARRREADYPVHPRLVNAAVLDAVARQTGGTYLLTQAYPEGAPMHPAYPAGHAVIAGACATVLKAFFEEALVIADPVVPDASGLRLVPWSGPELTVGGELNKLAMNVSIGRNFAGIHWRSDALEGLRLGEAVALEVLSDMRECFAERGHQLTLLTFEGRPVSV